MASPHFKHGRYTKDLRTDYRDRIQDLAGSDIISLRDNIAVLDARLGELFSELEEETVYLERAKRMRQLSQVIDDKWMLKQDANSYLRELVDLAGDVTTPSEKWDEILETTEKKRRLVESERRTMHEAKQMITVEQMMFNIAQLQDILKRFIDRPTLAKIGNAIDREMLNGAIRPN